MSLVNKTFPFYLIYLLFYLFFRAKPHNTFLFHYWPTTLYFRNREKHQWGCGYSYFGDY